MSLIKCPECGKEGVSDSAVQCPYCGYGVREHILLERAKYSEESNSTVQKNYTSNLQGYNYKESNDNQYDTKIKEEISKEEDINSNQNKVPSTDGGCLGVIILWICIIGGGIFWFKTAIFPLDSPISDVLGLGASLLYIIIILIGKYAFKKLDPSGYHGAQETLAKKAEDKRKRKEYVRSCLKCPVCESHNISRISTVERMISVDAAGLASDTMGKQYRCNECKHLW